MGGGGVWGYKRQLGQAHIKKNVSNTQSQAHEWWHRKGMGLKREGKGARERRVGLERPGM